MMRWKGNRTTVYPCDAYPDPTATHLHGRLVSFRRDTDDDAADGASAWGWCGLLLPLLPPVQPPIVSIPTTSPLIEPDVLSLDLSATLWVYSGTIMFTALAFWRQSIGRLGSTIRHCAADATWWWSREVGTLGLIRRRLRSARHGIAVYLASGQAVDSIASVALAYDAARRLGNIHIYATVLVTLFARLWFIPIFC